MRIPLSFRINFLLLATLLSMTAGLFGFSYFYLKARVVQEFKIDTRDSSQLVADRVHELLQTVAQKGHLLVEASGARFRNREEQLDFLKTHLALDSKILAVSRYQVNTEGKWEPDLLITRASEDPLRIGSQEISELDQKFAPDFEAIALGAADLIPAQLAPSGALFRLALPLGKKVEDRFKEVLLIEVRHEAIASQLTSLENRLLFVVNRKGELLIQNKTHHFKAHENLSHLPILQLAMASPAESGTLNYKEAPEASLQYGSYQWVRASGVLVVSQISETELLTFLKTYFFWTGILLGGMLLCAIILMFFAVKTHLSDRLREIQTALNQYLETGKIPSDLDFEARDEIGVLSNQIKSMCQKLEKKSPSQPLPVHQVSPETIEEFLHEEYGEDEAPSTSTTKIESTQSYTPEEEEEISEENTDFEIHLDEEEFGNIEDKLMADLDSAKEADRDEDLKNLKS